MKVTIMIDDLRIEKEISQEMRNNLIRLVLDIPAQRDRSSKLSPIPSSTPIIRSYTPLKQLPANVIEYLTKNPTIPMIQVSKKFGIPYNRIHYWVYKTNLKRKFRNLGKKEKQEIRKYILENPKISLKEIAKIFLTCPSNLGKHFSKEIKKSKELRRKNGIPKIKRVIPKPFPQQLPAEVIKYLTENPEIPMNEVSRMFRISPKRIKYWAFKTSPKRKFRNLTRMEKKQIRKYILENTEIHLDEIARKFLTCPATLRRHFNKEIRETSGLRRRRLPFIPKATRPYQKRKLPEFYSKTKAKLLEIILSENMDKFTSNDVYETAFGTKPNDDYKKIKKEYFRRIHMIRNLFNKLEKEKKIEIISKKPIFLRSKAIGKMKQFIWRKVKQPEKPEEPENFPFTSVSMERGRQALKQAIEDGKMTYLKDGNFFGYDMRRNPEIKWFNLLTYIAKLVKKENMVKSVKFNFDTKSLTFRK